MEFKVGSASSLIAAHRGRDRNRVEFKDDRTLPGSLLPPGRDRNRVEFKGIIRKISSISSRSRDRNRVEFKDDFLFRFPARLPK